MFDAGRLRERITIRRRTETKNDGGGLDVSWATLADNLAAEVISIDGREALVGSALMGIRHFQLTVRLRDDLKQADQILWNGMELNIGSVGDRLGTKQWTTIHATNEAPQGA